MAQQTAVEWLVEKYNYITWLRNRDEISAETAEHYKKKYLEQAKQMEKEQMIGLLNWMNEVSKVEPMRLETDHDDIVDQYYNETYGK